MNTADVAPLVTAPSTHANLQLHVFLVYVLTLDVSIWISPFTYLISITY